ncbi:MAG: (2Fe-2S) ferredoxin domain-containing protein [Planctomycetota bacterium]|jgi:(2Fe-2S) ferredoxin
MPKFERHVFVCTNQRDSSHPRGCCSAQNSAAIVEAFRAALAARGLIDKVRANKSGCLDQCEHGPTVVVYPEQVWYGFVRTEDVEEIVNKHIIGGRPVERLMLPDECLNTTRCPHRGAGMTQLGLK